MTRSIGDFYMHNFGISWKPEVISIDLAEVRPCSAPLPPPETPAWRWLACSLDTGRAQVTSELSNLTLVICSDGVWDLWDHEEVLQVTQRAQRQESTYFAQGYHYPVAVGHLGLGMPDIKFERLGPCISGSCSPTRASRHAKYKRSSRLL